MICSRAVLSQQTFCGLGLSIEGDSAEVVKCFSFRFSLGQYIGGSDHARRCASTSSTIVTKYGCGHAPRSVQCSTSVNLHSGHHGV